MRHLLLVSYYFPPIGGIVVRRALRWIRHLPGHGWRVSVLTADNPYDHHHPGDPSGMRQLSPLTTVMRAPARSAWERTLVGVFGVWQGLRRPGQHGPLPVRAIGGRPRQWVHETLAFPDPKRPWVRGAVRLGLEMAQRDPPDVVLATGYPWSSFIVGDRLGRALARPTVLDFRDPWTSNPRGLWSGPRSRALEREIGSRAAAMTTVTDSIRDDLRALHAEVDPSRITTIPNGFDPGEYPAPDPRLREEKRLVLVHTGTFNDALPPSPVDRTPYHLVQAITRLDPHTRSALRIRLVGRLGPRYRRWIDESVGDVVEVLGPVSHRVSLTHQVSADALLLVLYDCPSATGDVTGKLMEYVGAGRQVLALAPEGEASWLIRTHQLGWVVPPGDADAIASSLRTLVAAWQAGGCVFEARKPVHSLSAAHSSRVLARLLDRLSGR